MSPVKDILRLILITLLPIAYVALKVVFPDFPLNQNIFVDLVVWIVGVLIGGWNLKFLVDKYVSKSKSN